MAALQDTFGPALFGAIFQELLYWYDLRSKLEHGEYDSMLRSVAYWVVTTCVVLGSAYGATIWFANEAVGPKDYTIVGAAFPLLFKYAARTVDQRAKLGAASVLQSYLRGG